MKTENQIVQRVRHVDYKNKTALVLNRKNQAYAVNLSDKVIAKGIKEKDLAFIKIIHGIWIVVDFEKAYSSENDEYAKYDEQLIGEY